jgi:hypothetical protein
LNLNGYTMANASLALPVTIIAHIMQ